MTRGTTEESAPVTKFSDTKFVVAVLFRDRDADDAHKAIKTLNTTGLLSGSEYTRLHNSCTANAALQPAGWTAAQQRRHKEMHSGLASVLKAMAEHWKDSHVYNTLQLASDTARAPFKAMTGAAVVVGHSGYNRWVHTARLFRNATAWVRACDVPRTH